MRTVFVIDDHPVVVLGFRIALASAPDLSLVGSASEAEQGLAAVEAANPDCLVLDLVFEGAVAFSAVRRAREILPRATIVVFSSLPARTHARSACEAGADAYLGKEADIGELVALIVRLIAERPAAPAAAIRPVQPVPADTPTIDGVHLTRRELQIAADIAHGLSMEAIAVKFCLSPRTIAAHRENIRRKLDCRDSRELVATLARLTGRDGAAR